MSKLLTFMFLVFCVFLAIVKSEDELGTYCGGRANCGGGTFCCDFVAGLCCPFGMSCCRANSINYCCKQSRDGIMRPVPGKLAVEARQKR